MQTKAVALAVLLAANVNGLKEIGELLRTIGDIQQVSPDPMASTVTVQGTSGQLALSGWLIRTLDVPAGAQVGPPVGTREYKFARDTVVSVFYLSNTSTPQPVQEILTVRRTIVGVQNASLYTSQNAMVVRCGAEAMALVGKLLSDLNKTAAAK